MSGFTSPVELSFRSAKLLSASRGAVGIQHFADGIIDKGGEACNESTPCTGFSLYACLYEPQVVSQGFCHHGHTGLRRFFGRTSIEHPTALHIFNVPEIELHELLAIVEIKLRDKSQADRPIAETVAVSHIETDSVEGLPVFLDFHF